MPTPPERDVKTRARRCPDTARPMRAAGRKKPETRPAIPPCQGGAALRSIARCFYKGARRGTPADAPRQLRKDSFGMDMDSKKTALRMIPYGLYVMTAQAADGTITAATVNWVTQTSFAPPLIALGVKADSAGYAAVKASGRFTLNMLGKGQQGAAFAFFKPAEVADGLLSGQPFHAGDNGLPILDEAPAAIECTVVQIVEQGDHHILVAEVVQAHVAKAPEGRPDDAILAMRDLGEKVFYGG